MRVFEIWKEGKNFYARRCLSIGYSNPIGPFKTEKEAIKAADDLYLCDPAYTPPGKVNKRVAIANL